MIRPVILCGGSGIRLWPKSRESYPKQFIKISAKHNLLDLTLERIKLFKNFHEPIIVCASKHNFNIKASAERANLKHIRILEPMAKNTTAAIYFAAKYANPNDFLLIMPSDHMIEDVRNFKQSIESLEFEKIQNNWLLFGIKPTHASTSYGYIITEKSTKTNNIDLIKIKSFLEKPNLKKAQELLSRNNVFWNSGIFLVSASHALDSIKFFNKKNAAIYDRVFNNSNFEKKYNEVHLNAKSFEKIKSISIDFSVLEKTSQVVVKPVNFKWNDIGSWDSFSKLNINKNNKKNVFEIDSKNNYIFNEKRIIATIGINDLIIADTNDVTLIIEKGQSEKVKDLVEKIKLQNLTQAKEHSFEYRPWGFFENLYEDQFCKVKKIIVNPNQRLSLQYHLHRSEHWLITKGIATVYLDGQLNKLKTGMSIDIPKKSKHYVHNKTKNPLVIIETQLGTYFGEDDIIRLDDPYDR